MKVSYISPFNCCRRLTAVRTILVCKPGTGIISLSGGYTLILTGCYLLGNQLRLHIDHHNIPIN